MITHNDIPNTLRTPLVYVEFDNTGAVSGTPRPLHKTLLIALRNSNGNAATGNVTRIQNLAAAEYAFGVGSMGAQMAATVFKNNEESNLYALPLDELGVAAKGSITPVGSPTYGGMLWLYVAGFLVRVTLTQHMTVTEMCTAIADAINAQPDRLPVKATADTGKVALECSWKGDTGNGIDIGLNYGLDEFTPSGVELTIDPMANGSGAPDISAAVIAIGQEWFQHLINPFTDSANLNALRDELMRRWGSMHQIDGMGYIAKKGTFGALSAFGLNRNDHVFSLLGIPDCPTPDYIIAAAYGAQISKSVAIDPARPFQTLVMKDVIPPKIDNRFERNERNLLLYDGISTCTVTDGGEVAIERAITMYRTNSYGLPDPSYLDVNTPHTLSYYRYAVRTRITQKFPRHKLTDDETNVNPAQIYIVKPKTIRAELIALYAEMEWDGLMENLTGYKNTLQVERDLSDPNRVRVLSKPNTVNQLIIYSETAQFVR